MKKDGSKDSKSKKKSKNIDWEERLFQVAVHLIDPVKEESTFELRPFVVDRCIRKAKTFIKEYKHAYKAGKLDDIISDKN